MMLLYNSVKIFQALAILLYHAVSDFLLIVFWISEVSFKICYGNIRRILLAWLRRSCPEVFCKKGILRNFLKFTGKDLYKGLFFNKVAGLKLAQVFPVNFAKFLRAPFYTEHLWRLLLLINNWLVKNLKENNELKELIFVKSQEYA